METINGSIITKLRIKSFVNTYKNEGYGILAIYIWYRAIYNRIWIHTFAF